VRVELRPAAPGAATAAAVEEVVGRALRRPVAAGAPLPAAALERAAPFPRGHLVTALVRRGRLTISAAGALERPAPVGQPTAVRLRATGRVVRGRLVDPSTVLVEVSP
jgi:flagella basal body P-ring formation protein FlgA